MPQLEMSNYRGRAGDSEYVDLIASSPKEYIDCAVTRFHRYRTALSDDSFGLRCELCQKLLRRLPGIAERSASGGSIHLSRL